MLRFDERVRRPLVSEPKEAQADPEAGPPIARFGFRQERRPEHSTIAGVQAILPICDRRLVAWHCSEPRIAFNKTVVLRHWLELESRRLSSSTINLRLAAVRQLAYEAADTGLLSPELAAGIGRVKGAKRIGVRLGNWLGSEQVKELLRSPDLNTVKGRRDRAIIAVLAGCGLRRSEVAQLAVSDLQRRDDRWVIVDLYGKGGHIRTVPVPGWVKNAIDCWTTARSP